MFGNNSNNSKDGNPFGQPFGAANTTTGDPGFARIDALFGTAGQAQSTGSSPSSNLFGSQTFARNAPVFGSTTSTNASQTSNLFGTTSAGSSFGTAATGAKTGSSFGTTATGAKESNVFGSGGGFKQGSGFGGTFGSAASNTETTQSSVFGGTGQQVFGLFGSGAPATTKTETKTAFGKGPNTSAGFFGKPAASTTSTPSGLGSTKTPPATNPFKTSVKDAKVPFAKKSEGAKPIPNPFATSSVKPLFGQAASPPAPPSSLFGKTVETKREAVSDKRMQSPFQPEPAANLFGKTKMESVMEKKVQPLFGPTPTSNLFGKPAERKLESAPEKKEQALFGKGVKTELFGKKAETSSGVFGAKPSSGFFAKQEPEAPKKSTLFGKTGTSDDQPRGPKSEKTKVSSHVQQSLRNQIEERKERAKTGAKTGGLFGKALSAATASQARATVSKRPQPEDRAESRDVPKERKRRSREDSNLDDRPRRDAPKTIVRATSLTSESVALVARNVPASCNNKASLTRHFSKFGQVSKVFNNPKKASATIHFVSHEDALQAKRLGRKIKENLPAMQFFWSSFTPSKGTKDEGDDHSEDGNGQPRSRGRITLSRKSIDSRLKASKRIETYGEGVDDELSGLRGTEDTRSDATTILKRPGRTGTPEPSASALAGPLDRGRARSVSPVRTTRAVPQPSSPSRNRRGTPPPGRPAAGAVVSLKSLGDSVANTANDYYTILDNRDKLIREAMNLKNRDWAHAAATKGTCPDMCSEKERYMREDRHQLSIYEAIPGTERVDHHRAVKEYSRSSADQEMPLPHELRPADILDRTMTYLLNNIVDQGKDGMWSDWYDFLWNRTRAIRKDITQQHLCNLTTVSLIEKCVRFHIYAGHRLCEEPMNAFDIKINNENLTKCLQTLKEFYHDLKVKHNTVCPHEAEFRAYMVLMNLNEGDALREAQQLPPEIRQSPEMTFALKAHAALNENNYVKFFKLACVSNFLQGCIIHRYFNQIRKKAIMVLLRAYRSVTATAYPLDKVVWLLKFESMEEAQDFCEHHGLLVREGCVILEKGAYVDPEAVFAPRRAIQLVGSKLRTSVGEAINGEPLPPNILAEPANSFDGSGRFMVSSVPLPKEEVEPKTQATVPSFVDRPVEAVVQVPEQPVVRAADLPISNEVVKELAKELFIEVISDMCQDISNKFLQDVRTTVTAVDTMKTVISETTSEMSREVAKATMIEFEMAKIEAAARKRAELAAEKQASRERASNDLISDITDTTIVDLVNEIAQEEYRSVEQKLRKESETRMSQVECDDLLNREVESMMHETIREFHQEHVVRRLEQLKQAEEAVRQAFIGRFFHQWKNEAAGRKRLKRVFLTFPAAPNMDPLPKQVQDLVPDSSGVTGNSVSLGESGNLTTQSPGEIIRGQGRIRRCCSAHTLYSKLQHRLAWTPINVGEVILGELRRGLASKQRHGSCYWKGVLSLPNEMSVPEDFPKWLRTKFTKGSVPTDIPSDNKSELLSLYSVRDYANTANVCVRCINGDLPIESLRIYKQRQDFNAVSGVVHLVYCSPESSHDWEFWRHEEERLEKVLAAMPEERVPLLVLFCHDKLDGHQIADIEMKLRLQNIGRETCKIKELELDVDEPFNQVQLQEGLEWLIRQRPAPPELTFNPVVDVIESMVTLEFSQMVYQDLASRRRMGHLDQPLEILVAFYNDAIEYLAETASDSELIRFSWPPPEFASRHTDTLPPSTWNEEQTLEESKNLILTMRLPEPDLIGVETWEDGCKLVWSFLASVAEESTQSSHVELYSRVRWLLRRSYKEMTELCDLWDDFDTADQTKCVSGNLPWTEVVMACVRQKFLELKFNPAVSEQINGLPKVVVYENKKLGQYQPPELWSTAIKSGVIEDDETLEMSVLRSVKRKLESTDDSPKKAQKVTNVTVLDIDPLRPAELEAMNSLHELETSVAAGKEESKALDDLLKAALEPDNRQFSDSNSNSFIQSQMPMYAVSPGEFQDLVGEAPSKMHAETHRLSLSDELNDFRAKLQSHKKAQRLETLKLERMMMEF